MVVFPSVAGVRNRERSFRLERQNKLLQLEFPEFYRDHKLISQRFNLNLMRRKTTSSKT